MSNKSKAKEIAQTRSEHLDEYDLCYEAAMKMANFKDDAIKKIIIKLKNRIKELEEEKHYLDTDIDYYYSLAADWREKYYRLESEMFDY